MADYTFPNQRVIKIHRESAKRDFLGIKNENWQSAARDLGAHATMLYLYLAANADGYSIALSPVAVRQAIGMARSTYHDQFHKLIDKGYLVPSRGNTFEFYEVPQTASHTKESVSDDGLNFDECPCPETHIDYDGQPILSENIEINNTANTINIPEINNSDDEAKVTIQKPKVKEIVISRPKAEGKSRPTPIPKTGEFEF